MLEVGRRRGMRRLFSPYWINDEPWPGISIIILRSQLADTCRRCNRRTWQHYQSRYNGYSGETIYLCLSRRGRNAGKENGQMFVPRWKPEFVAQWWK